MKKEMRKDHSILVGGIVAVASFVGLSVFAGGLVEISRDVGLLAWLRQVAAYAFTNKLGYKLVASAVLGFGGYFVSGMIAYGKAIKAARRARATRVRFPSSQDAGMDRIA